MSDDVDAIREAANAFSGTSVHRVMDIHLASALIACGVPLVAKPMLIEFSDGKGGVVLREVFPFAQQSPDGLVNLSRDGLVFKDPEQFIKQNPVSPLSFALCAIMQHAYWLRQRETAQRVVPFREDEITVNYLGKDTALYRAALRAGWPVMKGHPLNSKFEKLCNPTFSHDAS